MYKIGYKCFSRRAASAKMTRGLISADTRIGFQHSFGRSTRTNRREGFCHGKTRVYYSFGRPGSTTWREGRLRSFFRRTHPAKKETYIIPCIIDLLCREETFWRAALSSNPPSSHLQQTLISSFFFEQASKSSHPEQQSSAAISSSSMPCLLAATSVADQLFQLSYSSYSMLFHIIQRLSYMDHVLLKNPLAALSGKGNKTGTFSNIATQNPRRLSWDVIV